MKFIDLLDEKFKMSDEIRGEFVEIFENPTPSELREISKGSKGNLAAEISKGAIRLGFVDNKKGTMYAWKGDVLHPYVVKKVKFDFGFFYEPGVDKEAIGTDHTPGFTKWPKVKNKDVFKKKLKKILPDVKKLHVTAGRTYRLDK